MIDEVDRADEEFEAFLLEFLSDFQVTIPELGTISAKSIPRVIFTSNGTREISDALRRRCLYHYVDYPDVDREAAILQRRLPKSAHPSRCRSRGLLKKFAKRIWKRFLALQRHWIGPQPCWALSLTDLHQNPELVFDTMSTLLKTQQDKSRFTPEVAQRIMGKVA